MQNIQNKKVYSKQHKARTKGAAEPVIKNTWTVKKTQSKTMAVVNKMQDYD